MIEFYGEVSQVIKEELLRKARLVRGLWFLGLAILFYLSILPAALLKDMAFIIASSVVGTIVLLVALKLIALPTPKKFLNNPWEIRVLIDPERKKIEYTQYITKKDFHKSYNFKAVKKLVQKEYYYLLTGVGLPVSMVLEKRLLRQGTYAQLENLFQK